MAVEAGGIGARLRASREKLGLTVLQVAERIHTDPKIVEAIEAENYEALGAPVYARGHIRHYAELVGESAAELIGLYSDLSKVAQPDLTRIVKAPAGVDSSKLVAPALLVIAVFAVAGAVWWVSALSKKKPQLSETHVVGEEAPGEASSPAAPDGTVGQGQPAALGAAGTEGSAGGAGAAGGSAMQGRAGAGPGSAGGTAAQGRVGAGPGSPGSTAAQGRAGAGPGSPGSTAAQGRAGAPSAAGSTAGQGRSVAPGAAGSTAAQGRSVAPGAAGSNTVQGQGRSVGTGAVGGTGATGRVGGAGVAGSAGAPAAPGRGAPSPTAPQGRAGAGSGAPATSTPGIPTPSATASTTPPLARTGNQAQVTLRYSADSWTEVYDASGARLFYDVGAANSVQTVVGTPPLRVVLGNASGVAVEFNGHNRPVAKLAQPDGSVQFSINRSGRVVRAKPAADGG
jgi:cytoskeletal protein RodZ